jgi:hypothetical protein
MRDKAITEGAITVDAFIDKVKQQLKTHYDNEGKDIIDDSVFCDGVDNPV